MTWGGKSINPFRFRRSRTLVLEGNEEVLPTNPRVTRGTWSPLSPIQTFPGINTSQSATEVIPPNTDRYPALFNQKIEKPNRRNEANQEPSSKNIGLDIESTGHLPRESQGVRQKFTSRFEENGRGNKGISCLLTWLSGLVTEKPKHKPFTVGNQLRVALLSSWLNLLLLASPVGFVVFYLGVNPVAVFFVNFAAILPLNSIFSLAIDELMIWTGFLGGIMVYMSFG